MAARRKRPTSGPMSPATGRSAGALLVLAALGCGGGEESRGPARDPAITPAPTATASAPVPSASASATTAEAPPADARPSEAEITAALFAIPADPSPEKITLNTHYVVSNEDKPQVLHDAVAGRGGVYVGVGAEQSFLYGGWARADALFLMDFDDHVVHINEVHGLVFQHAATPADVLDLWAAEKSDQIKAWIRETAPDETTAQKRIKVYTNGQPKVLYRLRLLKNQLTGLGRAFFANDQAELDHVAGLWKKRRVRCVRGDLTASGALKGLAEVAKRAGWPVRVLYMSNAELYFSYDQGTFRENLRALPFDERSIVLHTHPIDSMNYHYIWQDARTYVGWMGRVGSFRDLLYEANLPGRGKLENGAWFITPQQ